MVDLINLESIASGYSIGGFDADKIEGDTLVLGIGTPTSDNERTKLSLESTRLLAVINGYSGEEGLMESAVHLQSLLRKYAASDGGELLRFGW